MAHAKEQKAEIDLQRSFRRNVEAQQSYQMSREVRLWLQASNSANDLRKLCETRTADTGTWVLEKEHYTSWRISTESSILWIYGIPGSGKSVLAFYIIDNLLLNKRESDAKTPVIYFFYSGRNETQRTSVHILRSLVAQLQAQYPTLGYLVVEAYKSDDMKVNIITRLDENAWAMFIWARLMIEQLETTESDEALEEALKTLPAGLSALYSPILMFIAHNFEHNDSVRDLGCFIICWVVHGARPLTLTGLSEARCIKLGETSLSTKKKPQPLVTFRRLIEVACAPLVEVQDGGLVQLAYHTTKEYLLTNSERLFNICNPIKSFGIVPCTASM